MEEQAPWYSKHWPTLCGLGLTVLVLYTGLIEKAHPNANLVPVVSFLLFNGLLWFCLIIAVTRYWAGSYRDRNAARKALAENNTLKMQIEGLEADLRRANEGLSADLVKHAEQFNRQMGEHRWFSPLQWEVFGLVRELREFAREVGPIPIPKDDPEIAERGEAGIRNFPLRAMHSGFPYYDRVRYGFQERFLERVRMARIRLAERSLHDTSLNNLMESVQSDVGLEEIAERLFTLAVKLRA